MNPQRTGLYARYCLLVAYLLEREGWSVDRLLASNLPQEEAEQRLLAAPLNKQIRIVRMLLDIGAHERTFRDGP